MDANINLLGNTNVITYAIDYNVSDTVAVDAVVSVFEDADIGLTIKIKCTKKQQHYQIHYENYDCFESIRMSFT